MMGTMKVNDVVFTITRIELVRGRMWFHAETHCMRDVNEVGPVEIYGSDGSMIFRGKYEPHVKGNRGEFLALKYEVIVEKIVRR